MLTAQLELDKFLDRRARSFEKAMMRVAVATFLNPADVDAVKELAKTISETLILADLHGRKRMFMEADAIRTGSFTASPIRPSMEFEEALTDLITREPRLAKSAAEVARQYSTKHVFSLAESASETLTKRVQEIVSNLIREGTGGLRTERDILEAAVEESHRFSNSYAATVYRTNVASAYAHGRIKQAEDPDIREVIPALMYLGVRDPETRPNHAAAFGLVASVDDPIWHEFTPPLGYNCRCSLEHVSIYELERRGLIENGKIKRYEPPNFKNAHKDGPPFS